MASAPVKTIRRDVLVAVINSFVAGMALILGFERLLQRDYTSAAVMILMGLVFLACTFFWCQRIYGALSQPLSQPAS
jgi:hypothetical protein